MVLRFCLLLLAVLSVQAQSEVIFEGYSKIVVNGKAVGYTVQKFEFDPKKKIFSTISFTKIQNESQSLKAKCNDAYQPLEYQYTTQLDKTVKTIDAKFEKGFMNLTTFDGRNRNKTREKYENGVFLSSFLVYLMLQNGLKPGKNFSFKAVAEEDGKIIDGQSSVLKEEKWNGLDAYRIKLVFKGIEFITLTSPKGEMLFTESAALKLVSELVKNPSEATKGFSVPQDTLKLLFGQVPSGKQNILSNGASKPVAVAGSKQTKDAASKASATPQNAAESKPAPTKSESK